MQSISSGEGFCPFSFNFASETFKVGDTVSYRVASMGVFPFAGELLEVGDDYVIIAGDPSDMSVRYRGTRENRPVVSSV